MSCKAFPVIKLLYLNLIILLQLGKRTLLDRGHIVTDGECRHHITHHLVLVTSLAHHITFSFVVISCDANVVCARLFKHV